ARDDVKRAIRTRSAFELEDALAAAGACATVARTREEWLRHEQGSAVRAQPLLDITALGPEARRARNLPEGDRPLSGVRVLDLTRVIAGPTATRTLAAHGADVLRVSAPHLPEIEALLPDTSIGKRSTFLDLRDPAAAGTFRDLLREADVIVQSYRPGALAQTREWLESFGRTGEAGTVVTAPDDDAIVRALPTVAGPLGTITYAPPAGDLSETPARFAHGPVAPGSDPPRWRGSD